MEGTGQLKPIKENLNLRPLIQKCVLNDKANQLLPKEEEEMTAILTGVQQWRGVGVSMVICDARGCSRDSGCGSSFNGSGWWWRWRRRRCLERSTSVTDTGFEFKVLALETSWVMANEGHRQDLAAQTGAGGVSIGAWVQDDAQGLVCNGACIQVTPKCRSWGMGRMDRRIMIGS